MSTEWLPWLLICFLFLFAALSWWVRGLWRSFRASARVAWAHRAEHAAETLLRRAGYRVVGRQVTARWYLYVDGEAVPVLCRADLIVRRRGRRFVAEVKSGFEASDPTLPSTRRQLLEYQMAYPAHGVLLVDMARGRVSEVAFPLDRAA
jgi:hypothetical protein